MEKTFIGEDLYTAITLNDAKMPYRADSKLAGQSYYTGRWGALGFTCSVQFFQDFRDGKVSQVTIAESSYKRKDASGNEVDTPSATIMGYITFDRQINLVGNMTKLDVARAKGEISKTHAKAAAIAELGLSKEDLDLVELLAKA